eukprot:m51a1_g4632 hypothetical protein (228) ;mRNA; r:327065-328085
MWSAYRHDANCVGQSQVSKLVPAASLPLQLQPRVSMPTFSSPPRAQIKLHKPPRATVLPAVSQTPAQLKPNAAERASVPVPQFVGSPPRTPKTPGTPGLGVGCEPLVTTPELRSPPKSKIATTMTAQKTQRRVPFDVTAELEREKAKAREEEEVKETARLLDAVFSLFDSSQVAGVCVVALTTGHVAQKVGIVDGAAEVLLDALKSKGLLRSLFLNGDATQLVWTRS